MIASAKELEIRYTTDGSEPSLVYGQPIRVSDTTTIRARAYRDGKPVSGVVAATFTKVRPVPADVSTVATDAPRGASCARVEGDFDRLPDLSRAVVAGTVAGIGLAPATAKDAPNRAAEHVALRFRGAIDVPEDDVYVFDLTSDDGSRLSIGIGSEVVVDNDGLHSTETKDGRVALARGRHAIEVLWFNKSGGAELSVKSARLGTPLEPVSTVVVDWKTLEVGRHP
jgi:hexosaminidase